MSMALSNTEGYLRCVSSAYSFPFYICYFVKKSMKLYTFKVLKIFV